MNNSPEQPPRAEAPEAGSIEQLTREAPDACAGNRLRFFHARHGDAALAYLSLPDIDPYRESLADDFAETFLGMHPDRESLIDSELEALGWPEELKQMTACHDIPEGMLIWNWPAIWAVIAEQYDVVERGGRLYVFSQ